VVLLRHAVEAGSVNSETGIMCNPSFRSAGSTGIGLWPERVIRRQQRQLDFAGPGPAAYFVRMLVHQAGGTGMGPAVPERENVAAVARAAFGAGRRLVAVERLRGGTKKGVYRLVFGDESTAVAYVWDPSENYWPAQQPGTGDDGADPFADACGSAEFEGAHELLTGLGVRTPQIYLLDRSRAVYPADIALVEDVRGGSLEMQLQDGRPVPQEALRRLRAALEVMHEHRGPGFGKIASAGREDRPCERVVLERALGDLADAAGRVERVAAVRGRLEDTTRELAAAIRPRSQYGLIHGELGPDHVLLDERGRPVIIDIEGLMFFDVEWEHAFLRLRFGDYYDWLRADDLDEQRLRFYRLALHLSLIAGPLRLLDGDFPDREPMREIAEFNIARALAFVQ
jgi:Phosphotransferase enzyme family